MQSLQQYIAAQIVSGSRKKFSSLHADFLENQMSELANKFGRDGLQKAETSQSPSPSMSTHGGLNTQPSFTGDCTAKPAINSGKNVSDSVTASLNRAADNGGPRSPMGQHPLSGRTPAASAPQSFIGAEGSDQN